MTAIRNTNNAKKLQKLQTLEAEAAAASNKDVDHELDNFDSILDDMDSEGPAADGQKRGKSHKSIKVRSLESLHRFQSAMLLMHLNDNYSTEEMGKKRPKVTQQRSVRLPL